ncbi:hypothetical protein DN826_13765 [Stutzerimonas nosocomialis]|uniref:hypothetical protein n=1 Tax=Stutzerimonas nosocomialis TaxID=1056496 RepID=UPI0011090545|nr:hypothetical protein [Stutzerimonas nosocomialis]TLX54413.1 hypothetical protein DN826_13765 [Stutzerimonas nosocomialis]
MHLKLGLVALCWSTAIILAPVQAGETRGPLTMTLTILPGCEVSSRLDDGNAQIRANGCAGAAAFQVKTRPARLLSSSLQDDALTEPRTRTPRIVTIYW